MRGLGSASFLGRLLHRPAGRAGLALAGGLAVAAVVGPLLVGSPNVTDYTRQLVRPGHAHWLGTDAAGRDELARTLSGLRTSLVAAMTIFAITTVVGLVVGTLAGYLGGALDAVLSRIIDVLLGLPAFIIALAIVGALGVGYWNLVAAIAVSGWAYIARIARSYALGMRTRPDVIAARMAGIGEMRNLGTHVVPGALAGVLVAAASGFADILLALAGLSFLGLGAQPPTAELGQMLADSRGDLAGAPWLLIGPTLGIMLSVAAATLLSDALRDATDPHWQRRRRRPSRAAVAAPAPVARRLDPVASAPRAALSVRDLRVTYADGTAAVRGVDLDVAPGECLAVVGESGCGKTSLARAALGILPAGASVTGQVRIGDREAIGSSEAELRDLRGLAVGYVAQDPYAACDPLQNVGRHIAEAWWVHRRRVPAGEPARRVQELGVADAGERLRQRPHQWSGGMLQRATIVAANAHAPAVTIADEPTSALDAALADDVLDAIRSSSTSVLLISHDLRVVAKHADRVAVMQAGRIVETALTAELLDRPRHPYTRSLLAASPGFVPARQQSGGGS